EAGLARAPLSLVTGGDAVENGARLRALLHGAGEQAERDIVALNAGALLLTAGKAATLRDGVAAAMHALRSGAAGKVLDRFVEASNG
ncbi:MAG: anthranilate phosphoribosyltransferase, partial [Sphingomicrobium sp.]